MKQILLKMLFSLLLILINPFGFMDTTEKISERISHGLASAIGEPATETSRVVLVVLKDESLATISANGSFPVETNVHANVLKWILCAAPSSIYVDISLQDWRNDIEADQTVLEAQSYFADSLTTTSASPDCHNVVTTATLDSTDQARRFAPVIFPRAVAKASPCSKKDPVDDWMGNCSFFSQIPSLKNRIIELPLSRDQPDNTFYQYPLFTTPKNATRFTSELQAIENAKGIVQHFPSPALAQTLHYCNTVTNKPESCGGLVRMFADDNLHRQHGKLVELFYQLVPVSRFLVDTRQPDGENCPPIQQWRVGFDEGNTSKWVRVAKILADDALNLNIAGLENFYLTGEYCLAYEAVSAETLVRQGQQCAVFPDCNREIFEKLKDKMIVYGQDIDAANDLISLPLIGNVPGMVVHASAADNLLTYGDAFYRIARPESFLGFQFPFTTDVLGVIYWLVIIVFIIAYPLVPNRRFVRPIAFVFLLFINCGIGILLSYFSRVGPYDWIGLTAVVSLTYAVVYDYRPRPPINTTGL